MSSVNKTYAFADVHCVLDGPSGSGILLSENGLANEGISLTVNERVTTVYGADGEWMHSIHKAKGGKITVRCLRTGAINNLLSLIYAGDMASSANAGQNLITISNLQRGDDWTITGAAIVKLPNNNYATEGGVVEWEFNAGTIDGHFGVGIPDASGA